MNRRRSTPKDSKGQKTTVGLKSPEASALNDPKTKNNGEDEDISDEEFDAISDDAFLEKMEAHKIGDLPRKKTNRPDPTQAINVDIVNRSMNDRTSVFGKSGEKPSARMKMQGKVRGWKGPKVTFGPDIDVKMEKSKDEPNNVEPVKQPTHQAKEEDAVDENFPGIMQFSGGFNDGFSIVAKRKVGSPIRIAISGENHEGKRPDRNMCVVQLGDKSSKLLAGTRVERGGTKNVVPGGNIGVWKGSMYNEADFVLTDGSPLKS